MSKHPTELRVDVGPQDLANRLTELRYDALFLYLDEITKKLYKDGYYEEELGHPELADCLMKSAKHMEEATRAIRKAWDICEPRMRGGDR